MTTIKQHNDTLTRRARASRAERGRGCFIVTGLMVGFGFPAKQGAKEKKAAIDERSRVAQPRRSRLPLTGRKRGL